MKINEKIYSLRKEHHLSQEELADKIGVSRQTVSKWELGESCPDFDKIIPLCKIFNITSDELLTDKKTEKEIKMEESKPDTIKALLICIAVFLYFIAIISMMFTEEYLKLNDGICIAIFLLICAIATAIIIFTCMTRPSKKVKKEIREKENKNPVLHSIISIITLLTTGIYLLISFMTMAWHLTWIIWIIYSIVVKIVELVFSLKENSSNEE